MILHAIVLALCEIVGFLFGPSIIYYMSFIFVLPLSLGRYAMSVRSSGSRAIMSMHYHSTSRSPLCYEATLMYEYSTIRSSLRCAS